MPFMSPKHHHFHIIRYSDLPSHLAAAYCTIIYEISTNLLSYVLLLRNWKRRYNLNMRQPEWELIESEIPKYLLLARTLFASSIIPFAPSLRYILWRRDDCLRVAQDTEESYRLPIEEGAFSDAEGIFERLEVTSRAACDCALLPLQTSESTTCFIAWLPWDCTAFSEELYWTRQLLWHSTITSFTMLKLSLLATATAFAMVSVHAQSTSTLTVPQSAITPQSPSSSFDSSSFDSVTVTESGAVGDFSSTEVIIPVWVLRSGREKLLISTTYWIARNRRSPRPSLRASSRPQDRTRWQPRRSSEHSKPSLLRCHSHVVHAAPKQVIFLSAQSVSC